MLFVQDVWLEMINEFAKAMQSVAASFPQERRSFSMEPQPVMTVVVEHEAEAKVVAAFAAQISLPPIYSTAVKFEISVDPPQDDDTQYRQRIQVTHRSDFYRNSAASRLETQEYVITKDVLRMRTQEDLQELARALALHCAAPYLGSEMQLPQHDLVQGHLNALYQ